MQKPSQTIQRAIQLSIWHLTRYVKKKNPRHSYKRWGIIIDGDSENTFKMIQNCAQRGRFRCAFKIHKKTYCVHSRTAFYLPIKS